MLPRLRAQDGLSSRLFDRDDVLTAPAPAALVATAPFERIRREENRWGEWRPDRESNPGARICSPLRHHSAIGPRARICAGSPVVSTAPVYFSAPGGLRQRGRGGCRAVRRRASDRRRRARAGGRNARTKRHSPPGGASSRRRRGGGDRTGNANSCARSSRLSPPPKAGSRTLRRISPRLWPACRNGVDKVNRRRRAAAAGGPSGAVRPPPRSSRWGRGRRREAACA